MRGTRVDVLLQKLKAQLRQSMTVGQADDTQLVQLLWDKQLWLASEYVWPFLEDWWDVALAPGGQFYAFPTTAKAAGANSPINLDAPLRTYAKWNDKWQDVAYDIGPEEMNYIDSELAQPLDPVQRWDYAPTANPGAPSFRVWPIPASVQTLRFIGQKLPQFWWTTVVPPTMGVLADWDLTKCAELDDELIVLFTAAERLEGLSQKDASLKLQMAAARLRKVGAVMPRRTRKVIFGDSMPHSHRMHRNVPIVVIAPGK